MIREFPPYQHANINDIFLIAKKKAQKYSIKSIFRYQQHPSQWPPTLGGE